MSTPGACGTMMEGENFIAGTSRHSSTGKESPLEKKLELEGEDSKDDLKVENETGSDLKVEDETGSDWHSSTGKESPLEKKLELEGENSKDDLKVEDTGKESTLEKKLELEGEDSKDDLKVEDETGSDLKVEEETGSDLKAEDGGKNGKEESSVYDPDDWLTWPNKDVFIKYYQQLRESDGFDFDEYPGSCLFAPIYPILGFERYPEFVDRIKSYASMAITKYFRKRNHKKERYVTEIVKINGGGPRDFNFYITFKIYNDGKEETFQAKVTDTIEGTIEIPICRRKKV